MNYECVNKILKKYDKHFGTALRTKWPAANENVVEFNKHSTLRLLLSETEVRIDSLFILFHIACIF